MAKSSFLLSSGAEIQGKLVGNHQDHPLVCGPRVALTSLAPLWSCLELPSTSLLISRAF